MTFQQQLRYIENIAADKLVNESVSSHSNLIICPCDWVKVIVSWRWNSTKYLHDFQTNRLVTW